jgi:1-aminocyclopropane-1-carboxylate deaminase/D-cysteine desulfhydrase-like pyridoxal-dependent ACC family enzyme
MYATITENGHDAVGVQVWSVAEKITHRRATYSSFVVHPVIDSLAAAPRAGLATLPTPLERGPELPGGARLWVKRDDLTGLGVGGNKARKLEFLCGQALAQGCDTLVTVGAAQSNHCRMSAAAGAILGMETHLVLSGHRPDTLVGNQLLSSLFGAHLHLTGAGESEWGSLEIAREALMEELVADGLTPFGIPIGGSTAVGALGYVAAFLEVMEQCAARGMSPRALVFTSSSGGTHAGLVAGRAVWRAMQASGEAPDGPLPDVVAVGVAKGVNIGLPDVAGLAREALGLVDAAHVEVADADVEIDTRWLGADYAEPTAAGDDAIRWAARHGAWVLDRTYTGKGFSGLLGQAAEGRWAGGDDVVFVHTGGLPAVFTPGGAPRL